MAFRNCSCHPFRFAATSLACKTEPEVDIVAFRRCSHQSELEVVSWGIYAPSTSLECQIKPEVDTPGVLASLTPPPPPSHARASRS
jgi:hypothetical protein